MKMVFHYYDGDWEFADGIVSSSIANENTLS